MAIDSLLYKIQTVYFIKLNSFSEKEIREDVGCKSIFKVWEGKNKTNY